MGTGGAFLNVLWMQPLFFAIITAIEKEIRDDFLQNNKEVFILYKIAVPSYQIPLIRLHQILEAELIRRGELLWNWICEKWLGLHQEIQTFFEKEILSEETIKNSIGRFGAMNTVIFLLLSGSEGVLLSKGDLCA